MPDRKKLLFMEHDLLHLISLERPPCCLQGNETHASFDEPFDEAGLCEERRRWDSNPRLGAPRPWGSTGVYCVLKVCT